MLFNQTYINDWLLPRYTYAAYNIVSSKGSLLMWPYARLSSKYINCFIVISPMTKFGHRIIVQFHIWLAPATQVSCVPSLVASWRNIHSYRTYPEQGNYPSPDPTTAKVFKLQHLPLLWHWFHWGNPLSSNLNLRIPPLIEAMTSPPWTSSSVPWFNLQLVKIYCSYCQLVELPTGESLGFTIYEIACKVQCQKKWTVFFSFLSQKQLQEQYKFISSPASAMV